MMLRGWGKMIHRGWWGMGWGWGMGVREMGCWGGGSERVEESEK